MTTLSTDHFITLADSTGWTTSSRAIAVLPGLVAAIGALTGTGLRTPIATIGALTNPGQYAPSLYVDTGTRVIHRTDVKHLTMGTLVVDVHDERVPGSPRSPTQMARIRELAPLSLREWGSVLGVTHTAIRAWEKTDSPTHKQRLDEIIELLEEARRYKPDLRAWLLTPIAGMDVRPVDLLQSRRSRAFRGALRAQPSETPTLVPTDLLNRRQSEVSWAMAEPEIVVTEEA